MGVEMEAGRPGWNDAMNGLPGLLGSGLGETYELLRLVKYLKRSLNDATADQGTITFPEEFSTLLTTTYEILKIYNKNAAGTTASDDGERDMQYWASNADARELYRQQTRKSQSLLFMSVYHSLMC